MSSILIIDDGLYLNFAERLTKEFDEVYYWSEWRDKIYTTSIKESIGTGIKGVTRVEHWAPYIDDVDVIFFPSCLYSFEQKLLEQNGYPCFGSGSAQKLENDRQFMKDWVDENKLPQVSYKAVTGIDNLLKYLKGVKGDKWVKISKNRGDMETYHHWNYQASEEHFMEMKLSVGFKADTYEFIVEDELRGVEYGVDTVCVDGEMPKTVMAGYEMKDSAYLGVMIERDKLPEGMKLINEKMCEYIGSEGANTFVSNEIRVVEDEENYLTDPTMRCPCPPIECEYVNIENIGEIIREGAKFKLVEPKYKKKYVAQVILKSGRTKDKWTSVVYEEKYKDNIRFYCYAISDDVTYIAPIGEHDIVCSVVGLGDTLEGAIKQCIDIASTVKCDELEFNPKVFDDAQATIEEGEEVGVKIF